MKFKSNVEDETLIKKPRKKTRNQKNTDQIEKK
jgi:hypothetical protein